MNETHDIPPNQTLYIKNLPEKIKKDALRQALYAAFCQFGVILDVVAMKSYKLRGQAWIVFKDVTCATNAKREMQNFPFYDKPMQIEYAKGKSDAVAKLDGTYKPREKRQRTDIKPKGARKKREHANSEVEDIVMEENEEAVERVATAELGPRENLPPNNVLLAKSLPDECNLEVLNQLFKQYHGFKEVRMVPGRKGIAFIEFEQLIQASNALQGLYGFKLTATHLLDINFAK